MTCNNCFYPSYCINRQKFFQGSFLNRILRYFWVQVSSFWYSDSGLSMSSMSVLLTFPWPQMLGLSFLFYLSFTHLTWQHRWGTGMNRKIRTPHTFLILTQVVLMIDFWMYSFVAEWLVIPLAGLMLILSEYLQRVDVMPNVCQMTFPNNFQKA